MSKDKVNKSKKIVRNFIQVCLLYLIISTSLFSKLPLISSLVPETAIGAKSPIDYLEYENYTYDRKSEAHPAKAAYRWKDSITRDRLGTSLSGITDIAVTEDGIYLACKSGVLLLDKEYKLVKTYNKYVENKQEMSIKNPAGLFVNDKKDIYVTLPGESKIIKLDASGKTKFVYGKPENLDLKGAEYKPTAITVDRIGRMFVIGQGIYEGIIEISPNNQFTRFFGVNSVRYNPVELFWRMIATDKQRKQMQLWLPTDYSDISMKSDGFIYATVASSTAESKVQLLNAKGTDILRFPKGQRPRGDIKNRPGYQSSIVSVDSRDDGIFAILDITMKRVFVYDENGYMLCNFGRSGDLRASLNNPVEIAFNGDDILVLDQLTQSLEIFEPTKFGRDLLSGAIAEHKQDNVQSEKVWSEIIKDNPYLSVAYVSLGNSAYRQGNFEDAQYYYKRAYDLAGYSKAYGKIRDKWLNDNFNVLAISFTCLVVVLLIRSLYKRRRRKIYEINKYQSRRDENIINKEIDYEARMAYLHRKKEKLVLSPTMRLKETLSYPGYVMTRPFKAFADLKYESRGSLAFCFILLFLRAIVAIVSYSNTGFLMNQNDPEKINTVLILLASIAPFILFSIANWSSTTLMNGSGKLKEIFMVLMYAQIPALIIDSLLIFFSNVMTLEELPLLLMLQSFSVVYSAILAFIGLVSIHEFTFTRAVASIVTTIVAALIILFIILLLTSLTGELWFFLRTVVKEIILNKL